MIKGVNEYYELIGDMDLNSSAGYHSMILHCPQCHALFNMKACGNRSLFPWFGYHPTDGNCQVINDDLIRQIEVLVDKCQCDVQLVRITTKGQLDNAIIELGMNHGK